MVTVCDVHMLPPSLCSVSLVLLNIPGRHLHVAVNIGISITYKPKPFTRYGVTAATDHQHNINTKLEIGRLEVYTV